MGKLPGQYWRAEQSAASRLLSHWVGKKSTACQSQCWQTTGQEGAAHGEPLQPHNPPCRFFSALRALLVIMIRILRLLLRPDHGDKAPIPLARAEPGSFRAAAEKGRYYAPDYRTRRNTVLRELSRAAS